jgi:hypothetical protein
LIFLNPLSKRSLLLLFILLVASPYVLISQVKETETTTQKNIFKGGPNNKIKTRFNNPNIELKKGALVSNVLKVVNNSNENINFTVDVLLPYQWMSILDVTTIYNVAVRDTVIIPVLLVPSKASSKSSEVIINAFLVDIDGQQIGDNSFTLKTKKKINWEIKTNKGNRFYFKNDDTTKKFDFSIINNGNYKQDIYLSYLFPQKNLTLTDTLESNNSLIQPSETFSLELGEEKSFYHLAKVINLDERNKRKISITDYNPNSATSTRRHSVIVNTSEPQSYGKKVFKRNSKIDFIKLPNEIDYQNFGQNVLPLTVDLTVQNLLSDNPFTSLNLRGLKQLSPNENLIYSSELNYTKSYFDNNVFDNLPWYVGYFNDRMSVEIGQVGSNVIGMSNQGKGIRTSYRVNDNHRVGAFYVGADGLFANASSHSYGFSHRFKISNSIKLTSKFGRTDNIVTQNNTQIISLQPQIHIGKRHSFNLLLAQSSYESNIANTTKGYLYNFGYSTQITSRLKSNINARYNDNNFNRGNYERFNLSQRTSYRFNDKWRFNLTNSYQSINSTGSTSIQGIKQQLLYNNLVFSKRLKKGSIQSGLFYDYKDVMFRETHSKGITISTSTYNYETNLISSLLVKAGFFKNLKDFEPKDDFTFEFTSLTRYKTWNFTTKYNLGPLANTFQNSNITKTPQLLRLSLQNQYTFPNKQLVLQSNVSYNYQNLSKNHSFNFYPELFYFNNKGWRYSLRAAYTLNSLDYSDYITDFTTNNLNTTGKSINSNFNLGFNIRKEFGIPVPFLKKDASDVEFVSFMDVNGNGKKDNNEVTVGNVVIRLDHKEVITTNGGSAIMNKVPHKKYALSLLPLEKLDGWFPNVKDSIYIDKDDKYFIPFVRGIKIYGDVIIDLQKIAITSDKPMDLSRIKITATKENKSVNTLTDKNGHFEFYLPNGKYTLSMDESILSNNLRLSRNNIPIELKNGQEGIYVSFYILEKRRKVIIRDFTKKKK